MASISLFETKINSVYFFFKSANLTKSNGGITPKIIDKSNQLLSKVDFYSLLKYKQ